MALKVASEVASEMALEPAAARLAVCFVVGLPTVGGRKFEALDALRPR